MEDRRRHVVVAGAGVAGLETALALHAVAPEHVSVELIAPEDEFAYQPLAVAVPFHVGEVRRFPLARLAAAAGADLRRGALVAVDPDEKRAALADGSTVGYDILVLALGGQPLPAVPGALTFRGRPEDGEELARLLERVATGDLRRLVFAVPAGSTWPLPLYELALLTGEYLTEHLTHAELTVVTPEEQPLSLFGAKASEATALLLETHGIGLQTSTAPVAFEAGVLRCAGGGGVDADAVVALPKLVGPRLDGIPQDECGFVPTDEFGRVAGLTDVYAAGDLIQLSIKQGGVAAQEADAVADAIAADAARSCSRARVAPSCADCSSPGSCRASCTTRKTARPSSTRSRCGGRPARSSAATSARSSRSTSGWRRQPPPPTDALPVEVAVDRPAWTPV
jgi:sulfide:quinone oxidoreductase